MWLKQLNKIKINYLLLLYYNNCYEIIDIKLGSHTICVGELCGI